MMHNKNLVQGNRIKASMIHSKRSLMRGNTEGLTGVGNYANIEIEGATMNAANKTSILAHDCAESL